MEIDRLEADGTITKATAYDRFFLSGIPLAFQLAEWALVVGGLQYIGDKFDLLAAKIASFLLSLLLGGYVAVALGNFRWRITKQPYSGRNAFVGFVITLVVSGSVTYAMAQLVKAIVIAQGT